MVRKIAENLYSFPIRLPNSPLKWLNCYVVKGGPGERSLLVDSGFNNPVCRENLFAGMEELGLRPEDTDVFFSHVHVDHTGNGVALSGLGCRIFMGRTDYGVLCASPWSRQIWHMAMDGMPQKEVEQVSQANKRAGIDTMFFPATEMDEGDVLAYGGYRFRCLLMPGHTAGHMCLYDRERSVLLLGDMVLFDITPNITNSGLDGLDNLGMYLESLDRLEQFPAELALPGHRNWGQISLPERIEQLRRHHARRLEEAERIVEEHPGVSAYGAASRMTWQIKAGCWDKFPVSQKQFATGEANAHLIHLVELGVLRREVDGQGYIRYWK